MSHWCACVLRCGTYAKRLPMDPRLGSECMGTALTEEYHLVRAGLVQAHVHGRVVLVWIGICAGTGVCRICGRLLRGAVCWCQVARL